MRKWLSYFVGLIILCLCVGGGWMYSYHNSGEAAWKAWKAERVEKGDRFDWPSITPPAVPENENFAYAPIVKGAILGKDLDPRFKALEVPGFDKVGGDWRVGTRDNLKSYADALGEPDIVLALKRLEPGLLELKAASCRPRCRLPIDYSEGMTPGLLGFRGAVRTLRARALAELASDRSEVALQDVLTCLRVSQHLEREPSLLAVLLRSAISSFVLQVVWEGIQDHRWNEKHLQALQEALAKVDLLASLRLAFEGERLGMVTMFENTIEGKPSPTGTEPVEDRPIHRGRLWKGWMYRNLIQMDRYYVSCFLDVIDPSAHRVQVERWVSPEDWLKRLRYRKDLVLAQIAMPALGDQVIRISRLQSGIDQALIACALERFRLANGAYPQTLSELVPQLLAKVPHDLINGEPFRYHTQGPEYLLYSVGWNRKDEGGKIELTTDSKPSQDSFRGDWTWAAVVNR